MDKKQKVALLTGIQQGTTSIEQLLPMEVHFITRAGEMVTINDKQVSEADALNFEAAIKKRNQGRSAPHLIWHETKTYQ